jgi:predicted dehydrogenase
MTISIGVIGTGNIFPAYMKTLKRFRQLTVVGVASSSPKAATRMATAFGLKAMAVDDLLASEATIILNLTPPLAHHAIGMKVLQAGKHLFTEKPLAATFAEGKELVALAKKRKLRMGCAPDTFLGAGAQATRAFIDSGTLGTIRHGTAHFMCHGPDHWHPNPNFFYQQGAGPLMDVGVYYVTHLVNHLGPVASVSGKAHTTYETRVIALGANQGKRIPVEVPTHIVTHLNFVSGAQIVLTSSFDIWKHSHAPIELYGDEGSLVGHDPNLFSGRIKFARQLGPWETLSEKRPYTSNARGIGLIDMALSIERNVQHRCNDTLALHVLEVMERALDAARTGRELRMTTRCLRPEPLSEKLF